MRALQPRTAVASTARASSQSDDRFALLLCATVACASACAGGADGSPDFRGPAPFQSTDPLASNATTPNEGATGNGNASRPSGALSSASSNEAQAGTTPIASTNGSGVAPSGNSSGSQPSGNNSQMPASNMMAQNSVPTMPAGSMTPASNAAPPTPPGNAFFFDDFEGSSVRQAPALWDYFVAWVANQNNPSGSASALIDDTRAVSGTHSVHFVGGQNPAQITLPLPPGTNRLYVRAQVFMTRQLGQNPGANHETLIGIRATPGQASNEVRFGEIKGVIGTNEVPTDNISPRQDQWGKGPAVAPNQWHCIEVQFLGDQPQNQLLAYVDGQLVHSVTEPGQWNNGNLGGNWMGGKFVEVVLGWHSFSGINTDVWMDDVVLSASPIGCP